MEFDDKLLTVMVSLALVGVSICVWIVCEELRMRRQIREAEAAAAEVIRMREEMRPHRRLSEIEKIRRRAAEGASDNIQTRYDQFMIKQAEVIKYPMPKEEE